MPLAASQTDEEQTLSADSTPPTMPALQQSPAPGFVDTAAAALRLSTNVGTLYDHWLNPVNPNAKSDPNFDPLDSVPKGYEPYAEKFLGSTSPDEIENRRQQIDRELSDKRTIASAGKWGMAASMAAGATDPLTLATMMIPFAGETRLIQAGRGALAFGAGTAVQEGITQGLQLTHTPEESLFNVSASMLLGSVVGSIIKPRIPAAELDRLTRDLHSAINGDGESGILGPDSGHGGAGGDTLLKHPEGKQLLEDVNRDLGYHAQNLESKAKGSAVYDENTRAFIKAQEDLKEATGPLGASRDEQIDAEMQRIKDLSPEEYAAMKAAEDNKDLAEKAGSSFQQGLRDQLVADSADFSRGNDIRAAERELAGHESEVRSAQAELDNVEPPKSASELRPEILSRMEAEDRVTHGDQADAKPIVKLREKAATKEARETEAAQVKAHAEGTANAKERLAKATERAEQQRAKVNKYHGALRAYKALLRHDREMRLAKAEAQEPTAGEIAQEPGADGAPPEHPESPQDTVLREQATANVKRQRMALAARASAARRTMEKLRPQVDPDALHAMATADSSLADLRTAMENAKTIGEKASLLPESLRQAYEARIAQIAKDLETTPAQVTQGLPEPPVGIGENNINPNSDSTAGAMQASTPDLRGEGVARGAQALAKFNSIASPLMRLLTSPNIETRKVVQRMLNIPFKLEKNYAKEATGNPIERRLWKTEGIHWEAMNSRSTSFKALNKRMGAEGGEKWTRKNFDEAVTKAMRNNDEHEIPEIAQAAKDTRRIAWEPYATRAKALDLLPKDVSPQGAKSYIMRQYDIKKINKDPNAWLGQLQKGFMKQGAESAEALDMAHRVTRNIMGMERGMMDYKIMDGIVPKSGRLKERTINLPEPLLVDWLNNDINSLEHSYLRSMAPEVEFTEEFGSRDMKDQIGDINDEASRMISRAKTPEDAQKAQNQQKRDLENIAAVRDRLFGIYGQAADPSSAFIRAGRMMRSVNATRLLGVAAFSHIPDLASAIMRYGMGNTFAGIMKMVSSSEARTMAMSSMKRLGVAIDMHAGMTSSLLGDYQNHSAWVPQQIANRVSRAFTIATGETPLITMIQGLTGTLAQDELLRSAQKVAGGGTLAKNVEANLLAAGLNADDLKGIAAQHEKFGMNVNGLHMGMSDKWEDQALAQKFESAIIREAHGVTLRPGAGDTPLIMSTEIGKFIGQFKSFGFAATNSVVAPIAQGVAHGDPRAAQALLSLVAAGTASYYIKMKIAGQEPESWTSPKLATEILDKSNLLGWTGEYIFPAANQLGFSSMSRFSDRDLVETLLGPSAGTATDAFARALPGRFLSTAGGVVGLDREGEQSTGLRRSDIHFIRKLLPAQNHALFRQAANDLEDKLGNAFDLPGKSNAEKAEEAAGTTQ